MSILGNIVGVRSALSRVDEVVWGMAAVKPTNDVPHKLSVQLLDSVEQVLHGEDENAGVLVSVIDVALVFDEPNAILLLGSEREVTPLL